MTTTPVLSVATGGNYTAARSYSTAVGCVQAIVQGKVSNKYFLWGIRVDGSQRPAWPSCFWRKSATSNFSLKLRKQHIPLVSGRGAEDSFFPNVNEEDEGEMYDKLFDKYGKVVYSRNDKNSPSAEIDDDAESLSFAVAMAKVASEVKAADIKVLFVKPLVYWTRFFIIATAFSRPQIDAIGSRIRDLAESKYGKVPSGDTKPNSWTLLDFGDVVIHIFLPPQRAFYNLEEFYGNATPIQLPFENQRPPFHP